MSDEPPFVFELLPPPYPAPLHYSPSDGSVYAADGRKIGYLPMSRLDEVRERGAAGRLWAASPQLAEIVARFGVGAVALERMVATGDTEPALAALGRLRRLSASGLRPLIDVRTRDDLAPNAPIADVLARIGGRS